MLWRMGWGLGGQPLTDASFGGFNLYRPAVNSQGFPSVIAGSAKDPLKVNVRGSGDVQLGPVRAENEKMHDGLFLLLDVGVSVPIKRRFRSPHDN